MANSNNRIKEYETVHHLISRIAHRVYFLKESERMDFLEFVRRAAEFTGIRLIGWCVMGNHFHLLVFLPQPEMVDESEILRRYAVLKGRASLASVQDSFARWRIDGEAGGRKVEEWLERQRQRMYSVASFMKIAKQWFTMEYNKRNGHKGTLWESTYYDRVVIRRENDMVKCLAYIHLNPIRAAAADRYDGYVWSSYSAFKKGDSMATAGMRFVYGDHSSDGEIALQHEELMSALLEEEKRRRAEEIARRRAAGYEVPADPLTTEALIAQRATHIAEVQKALVRTRIDLDAEHRRSPKRQLREEEALALLKSNPEMDVPQLAEHMRVSISSAYIILARMKKRGIVERDRRKGLWLFPNIGK